MNPFGLRLYPITALAPGPKTTTQQIDMELSFLLCTFKVFSGYMFKRLFLIWDNDAITLALRGYRVKL